VIQYRDQSNIAFSLLVKSQHLDDPINFDELMKYSLTPVPYSLGTGDGFFNKTNKAAMLHYILKSNPVVESYCPKGAFHIQDGNALFHSQTSLPPTFGEICLGLLDQMTAKSNFIFSTDSYYPDSIKSQERLRRGVSNPYIISGPATRKPHDFKLFLANDKNKQQLCSMLLRVWGSNGAAARLEKCGLAMLAVEGKVYQLETNAGIVSRPTLCIIVIIIIIIVEYQYT